MPSSDHIIDYINSYDVGAYNSSDWTYPHSGYEWVANEWFQTFWYLLPLIILVIITLVGMKSYITLPIAAAIMYFIRLIIFNCDPNVLHWSIVHGFFGAFQPICIVFGAIVMFECMLKTGCMQWMIHHIKNVSKGHPVAEIMLIPFAFGYIIEGASGFGTPSALCAPVLVSLGHDEKMAIVISLCMNSFPVCLGAVGTPIWYGLSGVEGADDPMYILTAHKSSFIMMLSSPCVMPFIILIAIKWKPVLKNIIFICLSGFSCPFFGYLLTLGGYSGGTTYEFGSLLGGAIGFFFIGLLAWFKVGLTQFDPENDYRGGMRLAEAEGECEGKGDMIVDDSPDGETELAVKSTDPIGSGDEASLSASRNDGGNDQVMEGSSAEGGDPSLRKRKSGASEHRLSEKGQKEQESTEILGPDELGFTVGRLFAYTFPFYFTVFLLVITRIQGLYIKGWLQSTDPSGTIPLNGFGDFKISASIVLQVVDTFGIAGGTVFETFYIPFILPFLVTGMITCFMHWKRLDGEGWKIIGTIYKETFFRCILPFVALIGANAFSLMLRKASEDFEAPTTVIGGTLAEGLSYGWIAIASLLGSLGSFFSGSATVSNLTFGDIQRVAAETLEVSTTSMLALQMLGAAFGNMTCIFNILSVKTILGNDEPEGSFLKKTAPIMAIFWLISTAFGGPLFFATGWGEGMNFTDGPIPGA